MVALRKESVDRNPVPAFVQKQWETSLSARRAWIEILQCRVFIYQPKTSLSARRAWIEIAESVKFGHLDQVALRKESVDRNNGAPRDIKQTDTSLSARRAWIEMMTPQPQINPAPVALRKESVDRNRCCAGGFRYL